MSRIRAFFRQHQVSAFFLALLLIGCLGLWAVDNESKNRRRESCEKQNDLRVLILDLSSFSERQGGTGGLDLTALPSYPNLDPETQQWVKELNALVSGGQQQPDKPPRQTFREYAEERLGPPQDC